MRGPGSPPGMLFRLVIPATAVFIVTILSMIAVLFSDERAPLAKFLNRNGNALLAIEFFVVIVLSILAMIVDRRQILRDQSLLRERLSAPSPAPETVDEAGHISSSSSVAAEADPKTTSSGKQAE